jgi:signal transduction histidine kinase
MAGLAQRNLPVGTTLPGYVLQPPANPGEGVSLPAFFHDLSPLDDYQVTRRLAFGEKGSRLRDMAYTVSFEGPGFSIRYQVGRDLLAWAWPLVVLLVLEALMLLSEAGKARRSVRRILRPITEMSRQVANLSGSAGSGAATGAMSREELENLRKWAGALSAIDASRLDLRLSVDETQKELKDLAEAINRMLDRIDESYRSQIRFVSDASHELRTPISVIQGYVNLLDRWGKNDQATLQEAIDAIKSESESMKNLIEQLLFLARGDSETLRLELATFDVGDTLREVVREAEMLDPDHPFQVQAAPGAFIAADRQLIKQALRILVDNSIKYTPSKGQITVSVAPDGDRIRISVQDQGIGIDPDSLPYIFDRFYRSEESRTRKAGGAGLGLAIMKWIVDRHGGSIEVVSRKDIGTRTALLLPAAPVSPDGSAGTPECSPEKN